MIKSGFPTEYTGYGKDMSPEFEIKNLSENAVSLIITLENLSHPIKRFTHWIIWNIPATSIIKGGVERGKKVDSLGGAIQGIGYGFHRYAGPKPPMKTTHKYVFTIYAVDCMIDDKAFSTKTRILKLIKEHIIQKGEFYGYFV